MERWRCHPPPPPLKVASMHCSALHCTADIELGCMHRDVVHCTSRLIHSPPPPSCAVSECRNLNRGLMLSVRWLFACAWVWQCGLSVVPCVHAHMCVVKKNLGTLLQGPLLPNWWCNTRWVHVQMEAGWNGGGARHGGIRRWTPPPSSPTETGLVFCLSRSNAEHDTGRNSIAVTRAAAAEPAAGALTLHKCCAATQLYRWSRV